MSKDIDTIPTVPRHIVSYTILVEWADSPRTVQLMNEMPNHVDNVFNEWLRDLEDEGKAEIIVAKQRNGPTGHISASFISKYARFENLSQAETPF